MCRDKHSTQHTAHRCVVRFAATYAPKEEERDHSARVNGMYMPTPSSHSHAAAYADRDRPRPAAASHLPFDDLPSSHRAHPRFRPSSAVGSAADAELLMECEPDVRADGRGPREQAAGYAAKGAAPNPKRDKNGMCHKCDKDHDTDRCPNFKKERESHPDALPKGQKKEMGGSAGNFVLRNAKVVTQPGDGSCLFHSLAYGLGSGGARTLRREIAAFIESNPSLKIADAPISDWVKWDSQVSVTQYCSRMSHAGWGGGIEMAACALLKRVNVHVYERRGGLSFLPSGFGGGGYKRISCFDVSNATRTVHVLYCGGVHYDALVPNSS
jgi:hypothetical protein